MGNVKRAILGTWMKRMFAKPLVVLDVDIQSPDNLPAHCLTAARGERQVFFLLRISETPRLVFYCLVLTMLTVVNRGGDRQPPRRHFTRPLSKRRHRQRASTTNRISQETR